MDLLGGLDLSGASTIPAMATSSAVSIPKQNTSVDLLGDLFGGPAATAAVVAHVAPIVAATAPIVPSSQGFAPIKCYDKNGLVVTLTPFKELSTLTQVKATFSSSDGKEISNILFQIALPKVSFLKYSYL
jgi:hypothetical protein